MRWLAGPIGVFLIALAMAGPATAQSLEESTTPLAFATADPLKTSCSELAEDKGATVAVQNETAVPQTVAFSLVLSDENGRAVELTQSEANGGTVVSGSVCGKLTAELSKASLGPGETTTILLKGEEEVDARKFTGSLVVHSGKGRVVRKEVSIAAEAPAHDLDAVPLSSSVSASFEGLGAGTIWVPVEGEVPEDDEGTKPVTVGALSGPGDPVAVVYKGRNEAVNEEVSKLALELEGDLEPGTYSGTVDLSPGEEGEVTLEVKMSEDWELAAVLILIGILIGLGLLTFSGRVLPGIRLKGRVDGLGRRHGKAVSVLEEGPETTFGWKRFRIADLPKRQGDLTTQIDEALAKVVVKIEKSVLDNIEAAATLLEAQIDMLKEIPERAREMELALLLPQGVRLRALEDGGKEPKIEAKGRSSIEGEGVKADRLKARIEEISTMAQQVRDLRRIEGQLEELVLQMEGMPAGANRKKAEGIVKQCRRHLFAAEDAEGLKDAGERVLKASDEMVELGEGDSSPRRAVGELARAAGEDVAMAQEEVVELADQAEASQPTGLSTLALMASASTSSASSPSSNPPPTLPPQPRLDSDGAKDAIEKAQRVQLGIVALSGLVALGTGLGALYAGKTWGTFWDYPAAIIWGIGAEALIATLATSLDDLTSLRWLRRDG